MPAPQEFYHSTLYLIRSESAVVTIKDDISHISKIFWEDRLDN